ncbi:MAG TPA: very short patch repair endonuclease [Segetibacter sp.]|jgi:DNA mismatch endonuclease (patch repair protein)
MSKISGKETKPEILIRRLLFAKGFRYRKNVKSLPGNPDIVLPKYKTVIFVHGCFWHQHDGCRKASRPTSKVEFWNDKLNGNMNRDAKNMKMLKEGGWKVIIVWGCELKKKDTENLTERLIREITEFPTNC